MCSKWEEWEEETESEAERVEESERFDGRVEKEIQRRKNEETIRCDGFLWGEESARAGSDFGRRLKEGFETRKRRWEVVEEEDRTR